MDRRRSTFIGDLRTVLAQRDFRRLFATRLVSQAGDGIITAGVGTYVFFNASTFPSPAAGAASFTVLYLPYSLIGPFAGVLIDRWSRRQILVWSALLRATFVAATAALMAAGNRSVPLYVALLLVLGVNRFLLSTLSAAQRRGPVGGGGRQRIRRHRPSFRQRVRRGAPSRGATAASLRLPGLPEHTR